MTTSLQPRAQRLDLSFPVELLTDDGELHGHCLNVSDSGLLASFTEVPDLWITADLRLHFGNDVYTLPARVARLQGNDAGLSFCFRDDRDREAVRSIVAFAATKAHLAGGRPPF